MSAEDCAATNSEEAVRMRYTEAAGRREASLCCPVSYEPQLLEALPGSVLERDYGCGDPSRFVRKGDSVLDLGSGAGKICFIAGQIAGPEGRVIGVDENPAMLQLARDAAPIVADRVGYSNVSFLRGRIQDLALDPDQLDKWLDAHPVTTAEDVWLLEREAERLRREEPLIADGSVDLVVSNCVLNLIAEFRKPALFSELSRVLRPGGRFAISDITSDAPVPAHLKADPELWSGCVSGALTERDLLTAFEDVGLLGLRIEHRSEEPFAVVEGIDFRSVTITGWKGESGPCLEANQEVVYRGPWRRVEDDDGHVLIRGERVAVCAKTSRSLTSEPYAADIIPVSPGTSALEGPSEAIDVEPTDAFRLQETKAGGGCC